MKTQRLGKLSPVPLKQVEIHGGFWGQRLKVIRETTFPFEYTQLKKTGRIDAWKLEWKPGGPNPPHIFWDSDVAKWIEAAAYSLTNHPDPTLARQVNRVVDLIAAAQQPDGYLNTHYTVVEPRNRWTNLCRYADLIGLTFGRQKGKKRGYPGHPEIELALVKLYRATDEQRYLDLAKFFIDERGRQPHYFDQEAIDRGEDPKRDWTYDWLGELPYTILQANEPVRRQKEAVGHSVRALYLYSGMADVAVETGDAELLAACKRLWKSVTHRRMYVTGGVGSTSNGEAFTFDYDLPNETAYAETCASIALVFFAHRLLQTEADHEYADVMERALYNGVLSGISLDGKKFFYANPLAVLPEALKSGKAHIAPTRSEWFGCACCPPNIARLIASLGQYVYSQTTSSIYIHLFVSGQAKILLSDQEVTLTQKNKYPWEGKVEIGVAPKAPAVFTVAVRIPEWCRQWRLQVNGRHLTADYSLRKGYVKIRRRWRTNDRIVLTLSMPVERVDAHPSVGQNRGRIALQRGPVVYCLEEADNGRNLNDLHLPRDSALSVKQGASGLLQGIPIITGKALRVDRRGWDGHLYRTTGSRHQSCRIKAVPYFIWANRGAGEMLVWIRQGR
jgi:DUF1680 family protein